MIFNFSLKQRNLSFLFTLAIILSLSSQSIAELSERELEKIRQEAESFSDKNKYRIDNIFQSNEEQQKLKGFIGSNNTKKENISPEKAGQLGEINRNNGSGKCTASDCDVSSLFSQKAIKQREVALEESGFIKGNDHFIENNKGYLDRAISISKNAEKHFPYLKGGSEQCTPQDIEESYTELKTCDRYYDVKLDNCPISQIVEIDPKHTYQCSKKRLEKTKTCTEIATNIRCKDSRECDSGGIIPGSVASDMKFEYTYPVLTIGTIADNYWGGNCAVYDRNTNFKLKNLKEIKEFRITEVGFDDYVLIKVNEHLVYVGPDGGSQLEIVKRERHLGRLGKIEVSMVNNGNHDSHCERATSWTRSVNIDLKPYLREGDNSIFTRTIVSGGGESWMKIQATQRCCSEWLMDWEKKCKIK